MKVTVSVPVVKLCPYMAESDLGRVDITYDVPEGDAPELYGLADLVKQKMSPWADQAISHEEFTRWVLEDTKAERVLTHWHTAGLDVTCDLSRESDR